MVILGWILFNGYSCNMEFTLVDTTVSMVSIDLTCISKSFCLKHRVFRIQSQGVLSLDSIDKSFVISIPFQQTVIVLLNNPLLLLQLLSPLKSSNGTWEEKKNSYQTQSPWSYTGSIDKVTLNFFVKILNYPF